MAMQVGQMGEVLVEAFRHGLHDLFSLPDSSHEVALPAHAGVEVDIVAIPVLALEEAGVKEDVGSG